MTQITMGFFVMLELLRPLLLPGLLLVLAALAALAVQARLRHGPIFACRPFLAALALGLAVAVAAFLALPGWTGASLGDLRAWFDWAAALGMAAQIGALAVLLAYPFALLLLTRRG